MTLLDRLLIAVVVLVLGAIVGYLVRRRLHPAPATRVRSGLPTGLVVVTAPYCTRCASLHDRLAGWIEVKTIDAAQQPALVTDLQVTTAPTVLVVDEAGRIADREHRDFSDARLDELAHTANQETR